MEGMRDTQRDLDSGEVMLEGGFTGRLLAQSGCQVVEHVILERCTKRSVQKFNLQIWTQGRLKS